jgi:hypothetical protein
MEISLGLRAGDGCGAMHHSRRRRHAETGHAAMKLRHNSLKIAEMF